MSSSPSPYAPPQTSPAPNPLPKWPGWIAIGVSVWLAIHFADLGVQLARELGSPFDRFPLSWFLGAIGPIVSITLSSVVNSFVLMPFILRFAVATPSEASFEIYDERRHPTPDAGRFFVQQQTQRLQAMGFQPVALVAFPSAPVMVALFRLPGENVAAQVTSNALSNTIAFWSPLPSERERVTTSSTGSTLGDAAPPWVIEERFRGLEPERLLAIHRALSAHDPKLEGDALADLWVDPVGHLRRDQLRRRNWDFERGRAFEKNGKLFGTLSGVFFTTSRLALITQWYFRRRADRLSRERLQALAV